MSKDKNADSLKALDEKIKKAKGTDKDTEQSKPQSGYAHANIAFEFLGTIVASMFIGYWIDRWLETTPIFFFVFFFAGFSSAFLNIYKQSKNFGSAVGFSGLPSDEKRDKRVPNLNKDD